MSLSLPRTAELVGSHRWIERSLFGLTGAWSTSGPVDAVRGFLATQSSLHAWRAEQWESRRPASLAVPDGPPTPAWESALRRAAALEDDAERLAAWSRVFLPALLVGYRRHLRATAPAADAGTARWLEIALADASAGWLEGADLLAELEAGPEGAARRASALAELEAGLRSGLLRADAGTDSERTGFM